MKDRAARAAEQQRYLEGIEAVRDRLMALPNVVQLGVALKETGGQLTDQIAIRVSVAEKVPAAGRPGPGSGSWPRSAPSRLVRQSPIAS